MIGAFFRGNLMIDGFPGQGGRASWQDCVWQTQLLVDTGG